MGNQGLRQHVETSSKTGVFRLSKARLSDFPPELTKVVNVLRSIDLSENKLKRLPQNIGAFTSLKSLTLHHNQIESIPDQIGELSKLETMNVSFNKLTSVPETIGKLQKLREINLSGNMLTMFPTIINTLQSLNVLDLSSNRLTEIPNGVGALQVDELNLNYNHITKIHKDLANCPKLKTLRLLDNKLTLENIPEEIFSDSQISLINLEGNPIDMKKLQELNGYEKYMERYTATKKKLT